MSYFGYNCIRSKLLVQNYTPFQLFQIICVDLRVNIEEMLQSDDLLLTLVVDPYLFVTFRAFIARSLFFSTNCYIAISYRLIFYYMFTLSYMHQLKRALFCILDQFPSSLGLSETTANLLNFASHICSQNKAELVLSLLVQTFLLRLF